MSPLISDIYHCCFGPRRTLRFRLGSSPEEFALGRGETPSIRDRKIGGCLIR